MSACSAFLLCMYTVQPGKGYAVDVDIVKPPQSNIRSDLFPLFLKLTVARNGGSRTGLFHSVCYLQWIDKIDNEYNPTGCVIAWKSQTDTSASKQQTSWLQGDSWQLHISQNTRQQQPLKEEPDATSWLSWGKIEHMLSVAVPFPSLDVDYGSHPWLPLYLWEEHIYHSFEKLKLQLMSVHLASIHPQPAKQEWKSIDHFSRKRELTDS